VRVLILGGTRFLGVHLVRRLLDAGHDVTLLHRGRSAPEGISGAASILGDRNEALARAGGGYDAVVDTSGYLPQSVSTSAEHFRRTSPGALYAFVSSISVYRDDLEPNADEDAARCEGGDGSAVTVTPENYGALKARCEDAVSGAYGAAALVLRPGLIAGPLDPTDRFTYWVRRMFDGGDVLAPGDPQRHVQFVDARDVAGWIVTALERRLGGAFNLTGPQPPISFEEFLRAAAGVAGTPSSLHWAPDAFLLEAGVEPWSGLPLWIPLREAGGWNSISSQKARAAGFTNRPAMETIRDTLEWDAGRRQSALSAGISRETEARLLRQLRHEGA
jgi:2'-hydroxyisoflavone reductase